MSTDAIVTPHSSSGKTIMDNNENDFWTIDCIIEELFLCLAKTQIIVTNKENCKQITVEKYYRQAYELLYKIPVWKPSPTFVIDICDLTPEIKAELNRIAMRVDSKALRYVITQAVGRLFENLNFRYYHLSVAKNLRVELKK